MLTRVRSISPSWIVTAVLGTLALCGFALINGGPLVYPDTADYLTDGERLVRLATPDNTRPVFYGLAIWFLHMERTVWPVLVAQAIVVMNISYLSLRSVGAEVRPVSFLLLLVFLAAFTPLSYHVSQVMPDVFSGVLVPALFLLGSARDRMSWSETAYVLGLATACICFHLTNLVIGAGLAGLGWLVWLLLRRRDVVARPLLATVPLVLAVLAHVAFSLALYHYISFSPKSPPHFMARLIADGPGRDYLRQACPTRPFYLCRDLDELPDTENGILYRYLAKLPAEDGEAIRAEAEDVVKGTLKTFPLQVAGHMLENTARQFVTIGAMTELDPPWWQMMQAKFPYVARDAADTLQMRGVFEGHGLDRLNLVYDIAALASGLACAGLAWACAVWRHWRSLSLICFVFVALWINAFAAGALGGVFGRYQGRMIWLVPLCAFAAGSVLLGSQGSHAAAISPRLRLKLYSG